MDAFQGGEREIIILSCVRSSRLGFIESPKRLNVALTRARRHLIIVGHRNTLSSSDQWTAVIEQARTLKNGMLLGSDILLNSSFSFLGQRNFLNPSIVASPFSFPPSQQESASKKDSGNKDNPAPSSDSNKSSFFEQFEDGEDDYFESIDHGEEEAILTKESDKRDQEETKNSKAEAAEEEEGTCFE